MIDYLIKLLTDKPIIIYLEDPLASGEVAAWKKLKVNISI
jgi:enolase